MEVIHPLFDPTGTARPIAKSVSMQSSLLLSCLTRHDELECIWLEHDLSVTSCSILES